MKLNAHFTLRECFRHSEHRRFSAQHRDGRWAEMLGFTPDGLHMLGWWANNNELTKFEPDQIDWVRFTTHI
jgi:hypothetical protein